MKKKKDVGDEVKELTKKWIKIRSDSNAKVREFILKYYRKTKEGLSPKKNLQEEMKYIELWQKRMERSTLFELLN